MSDKAHNETDRLLAEMEAHLAEIYEQAGKEVEATAAEYFAKFEAADAKKAAAVEAGKLAEAEYIRWRKNKLLYGEHFKRLATKLAAEYAAVNTTALAYINGKLPAVYALNYNAIGKGISSAVRGYSFELVNADVVKNLAIKDRNFLPYKYLDGKKDARWNVQKVNSAILQGILQGESIPKMAKRLQSVTEMNKTSAIRNARTSVTGAECKGRQDGFERAAEDGIELQREWIATFDGRTRHSHRLLDGKLADVDKPFMSELGPIMYPGDPDARPENVYNCRCTIAAKVIAINGVKIADRADREDRFTAQDWWEKERAKDPKEFDIQQKMLYNKSADKEQLARYKKRLHGEAPRSLAAFQDMKYRDPEKYAELKEYYRYKKRVPESKRSDFEIAKRIKEKGIVGTIRVPAAKIDISNLSAVDEHAFRHGCTLEDAKNYIKNAKVSITASRWDGLNLNFYSCEGVVYVDYTTKKIKTMYSKKDYDQKIKSMMEEFG